MIARNYEMFLPLNHQVSTGQLLKNFSHPKLKYNYIIYLSIILTFAKNIDFL